MYPGDTTDLLIGTLKMSLDLFFFFGKEGV